MTKKPKMITARKALEAAVGKGKVIITNDPVQTTGGWRVGYEYPENGATEVVVFEKYNEAEEFCLELGGKNVLTVAAPMELLCLENWDESSFFDMGHKLVQISLMESALTSIADSLRHQSSSAGACFSIWGACSGQLSTGVN